MRRAAQWPVGHRRWPQHLQAGWGSLHPHPAAARTAQQVNPFTAWALRPPGAPSHPAVLCQGRGVPPAPPARHPESHRSPPARRPRSRPGGTFSPPSRRIHRLRNHRPHLCLLHQPGLRRVPPPGLCGRDPLCPGHPNTAVTWGSPAARTARPWTRRLGLPAVLLSSPHSARGCERLRSAPRAGGPRQAARGTCRHLRAPAGWERPRSELGPELTTRARASLGARGPSHGEPRAAAPPGQASVHTCQLPSRTRTAPRNCSPPPNRYPRPQHRRGGKPHLVFRELSGHGEGWPDAGKQLLDDDFL